MKLLKKKLDKEKAAAFLLSVLIHGVFILIIVFIKIEFNQVKSTGYSVLNFVEIKPEEKNIVEKEIPEQKIKNAVHNQKKGPANVKEQKVKEQVSNLIDTSSVKSDIDTTSNKGKIYITRSQLADTTSRSLRFAATLLDSFLVRHPEYGKYILQEQAKELVENKNIKKFSRLALEQRINEELDKYLQQHYPEGSEHEINPYTGPGLQIPIDDLIDAIKKIF
ncbi:MAG: hypothetical protein WCE54_22630 [Ignavibacteriaceae bacterium]